ncbi:hypothetical protein FBU59_002076 [Linderina macrospora]|uniref:Uncharacterized protein n=1 Tax=Linderina macrospora TaxID=4868 RepID=A0ACC1JCC3_9FUNG|nr:hypothetical protein FBU59_002076 [Linderina macrospora]
MAADTQEYVTRLCAAVAQPTSTYKDFARIEDYVNEDPERIKDFPDTAFSKLMIQCTVIIDTNSLLGRHEFPREWKSNIRFLVKYGKLHLVTDVHIAMYNDSHQPLELDKELAKIAADIGVPLPNVRSIIFLGEGVFSAGRWQTAEIRNWEANEAVSLLKLLFPQVDDLKYFLHNPIPANIMWLCEHIVSLSVNVEYIRGRPNLPPVSIGCLRILHLLNIGGIISWRLFKAIRGVLSFNALKELSMQFTRRARNLALFPGDNQQVRFPVLDTLSISGSSYVYYDIFAYFLDCAIKTMHIVDEPSDFGSINQHALKFVKNLAVDYSAGKSACTVYSAASIDRLFKLRSSVESAIFNGIRCPLPHDTKWINLQILKFKASVATADGLANLVAQLPVLQVLDVDCETTVANNVDESVFIDEIARITELGQVMDPDDDSPINESIEQVSIIVKNIFDYVRLCELISRLPKVSEVKVHRLFIKDVQDSLRDDFGITRSVDVAAYPGTF